MKPKNRCSTLIEYYHLFNEMSCNEYLEEDLVIPAINIT